MANIFMSGRLLTSVFKGSFIIYLLGISSLSIAIDTDGDGLPDINGAIVVTDIYVRREGSDFVFSTVSGGVSETITLTKGSTYAFKRSDSGCGFNIGRAGNSDHPMVRYASSSTIYEGEGGANPFEETSRYASISQPGETLRITIADNFESVRTIEDFEGDWLYYYCYQQFGSARPNGYISVIDSPLDTDSDGIGNSDDDDDDGDGVVDSLDAFRLDFSEWLDTDSDGIGNNSDTDDDNDGVADNVDAFPLSSAESADSDSDGIGNNTDTDDDNDGYTDVEEIADGTDPLDANSFHMGGLNLTLIKAFLDKQKAEQ